MRACACPAAPIVVAAAARVFVGVPGWMDPRAMESLVVWGGDSQLAQKIQATMLERKEEYALKPVPKMPGGDGSDRRH